MLHNGMLHHIRIHGIVWYIILYHVIEAGLRHAGDLLLAEPGALGPGLAIVIIITIKP